jgi:hypothetical protein
MANAILAIVNKEIRAVVDRDLSGRLDEFALASCRLEGAAIDLALNRPSPITPKCDVDVFGMLFLSRVSSSDPFLHLLDRAHPPRLHEFFASARGNAG